MGLGFYYGTKVGVKIVGSSDSPDAWLYLNFCMT